MYDFMFFLLLFNLIFYFSLSHTQLHKQKPIFSQMECYTEKELLKPWWQRAGHSHTTATLWVTYSHHRELPAEVLDANVFTPYYSFSCNHCRKVRMVDSPHLTFLYLWKQHILQGTGNLRPSMCFLKHQGGHRALLKSWAVKPGHP